MIENTTIRRFGEHTQRDYVRPVRDFTAFIGLPPDRAETEDLWRYQLHMASLGARYARMNLASMALRFFFHVTLGRIGFGDRMTRIPTPAAGTCAEPEGPRGAQHRLWLRPARLGDRQPNNPNIAKSRRSLKRNLNDFTSSCSSQERVCAVNPSLDVTLRPQAKEVQR